MVTFTYIKKKKTTGVSGETLNYLSCALDLSETWSVLEFG